jgi:heat shock protein HtpX
MGNTIKTTILLGALTILFVLVGGAVGGRAGMMIAFLIALAMNFISYWYSDKIVLKMYRAQEVSESRAPDLYAVVRKLADRADLPMPKVYIIPQEAPNAFATGRNPSHAVVAVTEGLLQLMDRDELEGVLAHELAHVRNRDMLIGTVAATLAGAVTMLATWARWAAIFGMGGDDEEGGLGFVGLILMSILAPIAAMIIQMAISRKGEYKADAVGAKFAGTSEGLAGALEKLGRYSGRIPMKAEPATAHMFIVNPLSGGGLMTLFSTHPPLQERIARLRGSRPQAPADDNDHRGGRRSGGEEMWKRVSGR